MEYIHEIMDSDSLLDIFNLPASLRNRKVEVIVKLAQAETPAVGKSAFGCLRRFANPAKIAGEKGAWERAVIKNHA